MLIKMIRRVVHVEIGEGGGKAGPRRRRRWPENVLWKGDEGKGISWDENILLNGEENLGENEMVRKGKE